MIRSFYKPLALVLVLLSANQFAGAQATRTWVSGVGDDVNPASRTAPCKTFGATYAKTAAGGEIDVIDAGGYGALAISKSLTIDGQGSMASIMSGATNGIAVTAGTTDTVTIRNIAINGGGAGLSGIRLTSGGTLILENVTIFGFTRYGVDVAPSADCRVIMHNVTISNCLLAGIFASSTAGNAYVDLETVKVCGCPIGMNGANGVRVTMKGCNLSMNTNGLIIASTGTSSRALLENCIITNTTNGITVGPGTSLCRMSNCTISNNLVGLVANSGSTLSSAGNNLITGNGTDGPTPTVFALK